MRVIVTGAGAIGLSAAHILSRNGAEVTVVESSSAPGGLLGAFEVDGKHLLEKFYHHAFTHDAELKWLLGEFGLSDSLEFRPGTMGILRGGKIYPFDGPRDLLKFGAIGIASRMRFGLSSAQLIYGPGYSGAENVKALDWLEKHAGAEAVSAIWRPMLEVKFGDAADEIPLAWLAGRLRQRALSRSGPGESLGYMRGSYKVAVEQIVSRLTDRGVEFVFDAPVEKIIIENGKAAGVLAGGKEMRADAVISTIPQPALSKLLEKDNPGYATELSMVEYLAVVNVVLEMKEKMSPVYWLNAADAGYDFGGIIEHTNLAPAADYGGAHIAYLSRYMPQNHELWRMEDGELRERMISGLEKIFSGVRKNITASHVFRARYAAPVPHTGFHELIPQCKSPVGNLFAGNMCHIYPDERSVNNSVRVAAEVVRVMGMDSSYVPRGISLAGKYGFS